MLFKAETDRVISCRDGQGMPPTRGVLVEMI